MKLKLIGHDYKYAVEQIMLSLFPDERPDYFSDNYIDPEELVSESCIRFGSSFAQATTTISFDGKVFRGFSRISINKLNGKLIRDRLLQKIIKQSFYRAAVKLIDTPPVWGSLTGIRPAHIAAKTIESGLGVAATRRYLADEYYVSPKRAEICTLAAQAALELKRNLLPNDIALYIGIPFCPTRCTYCSFVSNSVGKTFGLIEPFAQLLIREIDLAAAAVRKLDLRIVSVYIGGGTPSILPDDLLEKVLSALHTKFDLSHVREYTFEAGRPDTITIEKLEIIRKFGADRICINPQSMSDDVLAAIGRNHSHADIISAAKLVRSSGAAMNMDIIAGLPADTLKGFERTIDSIVDFAPENITVHTLSLKKGSRVMLDGTAVPSGDDVGKMLDYAFDKLSRSGYIPYYLYRQKYTSGGFENIGWCLPGYEGIYNICMMEELCTVLALGGGGVTKLVSAAGRIERIFNAKYPREYILYEEKLPGKYNKFSNFHLTSNTLQEE